MKFYAEIKVEGRDTEITISASSPAAARRKIKAHFGTAKVVFVEVTAFCDLNKTDKYYRLDFADGSAKVVHLEGDMPTSEEENRKQLLALHGNCKIKRIWQ